VNEALPVTLAFPHTALVLTRTGEVMLVTPRGGPP
jgi:hypothetical protein